MGLIVSIYRNAELRGDCTAGGVSSRYTRLTLTNVSGPFEPTDDAPAAILESHYPRILRIRPLEAGEAWVMFGGNFAATSDSRFRETCERLTGCAFYGAVAIHDRVERGQDGGGN